MKKRRLAIILSGIAVVALIGGTYAAFTASTTTQHSVSTQNLKIALVQGASGGREQVELSDKDAKTGSINYTGMPGDEVKEELGIKNEGSEDCFVRVTITRSWLEDGEKVFEKNDANGDIVSIDPKEIEIMSGDDWYVIQDPDDSEVMYCYYRKAISKGQETSYVMKQFSLLKNSLQKNSNVYAGLSANIEFEVDAIQAYAAKDAMLAEWGVIADITNNDTINGIPQFQ